MKQGFVQIAARRKWQLKSASLQVNNKIVPSKIFKIYQAI
jgi:hypothetical protein